MNALTRMIALLCLLLSGTAGAEQVQSFGDYRVHYSAFNSSFLQPEVAQSYGLVRSRNRGVLMVTLQRGEQAVPARVRALAEDIVGRTQVIELREVRAGEAVYYVGDFAIIDGETLRFTVDVFPTQSPETLSLHFRQQLFTD